MRQEVIQKVPEQPKKQTPNLTGIPTQMKLDFERRSGLSFDDVRVHYNSDKPRKIGALAYTQIPQVHIGPGQERHLRHELGHVVQQKRGIVRPTTWINGLPVNDSLELEKSANTSMPVLVYENPQFNSCQNSVVQGLFRFSYDVGKAEGNRWHVEEKIRPTNSLLLLYLSSIIKSAQDKDAEAGTDKSYFTDGIGVPHTAYSGRMSINHIVPANYVMNTLDAVITKILNLEQYRDKDVEFPRPTIDKSGRSKLNELILSVMPEDFSLPTEYERIAFKSLTANTNGNSTVRIVSDEYPITEEETLLKDWYEAEIESQRNMAYRIADSIFPVDPSAAHLPGGKLISASHVTSSVTTLMDILANALLNVRMGASSRNMSISDNLDPIVSTVQHGTDKVNIDPRIYGMSERRQHLNNLSAASYKLDAKKNKDGSEISSDFACNETGSSESTSSKRLRDECDEEESKTDSGDTNKASNKRRRQAQPPSKK